MRTDAPISRWPLGGLIASIAVTGGMFLYPVAVGIGGGQHDNKDAEIERLRKENEILKASVNLLNAKLLQAELERKQLTSRAVTSDAQLKAVQARNEQLVEQIRELTRKLIDRSAPLDKGAARPNPPQGQIGGIIEKVDRNDRTLVMLSIGSDAGLVKGHTLEVFRTKPRPKYIGMVRIIEVTAMKAVGRLVSPAGATAPTVEVGDEVASRLDAKVASPKK